MEEKPIERTEFRSSLLKQIIIRVDFDNLSNLETLISELKREDYIRNSFRSFKTRQLNNIDIDENTSLIDRKYLSVNRVSTENVHEFFNSTIEPIQEVSLDIKQDSFCIGIWCNKDYNCIDEYLELTANLIVKIQNFDPFMRLKRIAIRKIDGQNFKDLQTAYKTFRPERFAHDDDFAHLHRVTSKFKAEEYFRTGNNIFVNLGRCVEVLDEDSFNFTLDIDAYVDQRLVDLNKTVNKDEISSILAKDLNDTSFKIFREFVTEDFLKEGNLNYKNNHHE